MIYNMLPNVGIDPKEYGEPQMSPSYTWKLDPNTDRIAGFVDELDAVQQAVFMTLKTERGKYEIYPDWFGIELQDLIGKPQSVVRAVLPSRIEDALIDDVRIQEIRDFDIKFVGTQCRARFTIDSVYGETQIDMDLEV